MDTKVIATIKPELLPGFELTFEKDRFGDYSSYYNASLTVKIGNKAVELKFREYDEWHPAEYADREDGGREKIKDSYSEKIIGVIPSTLTEYEDLGIDVDVTELNEMYKTALTQVKEVQAKEKEEKYVKSYKASWIHTALTLALASKKKPADMIITKTSMGTATSHTIPVLIVEYKGKHGSISYERVGHSSNTYRYGISGSGVPGYRTKYYMTLDTAIAKYAAFIDEAEAIANAKLTREEREKAERVAKAKAIKADIGCASVRITPRYVSGGRGYQGYYVYDYYAVLRPEIKEGDKVTQYELAIKVDTQYKDKPADPTRYVFGGLGNLTPTKVKEIAKILLSE